jgi:flagellar hook-associated protein 3 FlgL
MGLNIADIAQQTYLRSILTQVRKDLLMQQAQASSGKRADLFSDLGGVDSLRSMSLRADRNKIDTYKDNIATVKMRVQVMDAALVQVSNDATSMVASMQVPPQNTGSAPPGIAGFQTVAGKQLESLVERMNTQVDGRYLFAGGLTSTPPIDTSQMTTFLGTVKSELTTYYNSPQTAADLATMEANIRAAIPWTDPAGGPSGPAGYAAINAATNTVRAQVDDGTQVDYTVKATEEGFVDTFIAYAIVSQNQYDMTPAATDTGFWQLYNRQLELMRGTDKVPGGVAGSKTPGGADQVTLLDAKLGVLQKDLEATNNHHDNTAATLETFIGQVEDTDVADALSRVQSLQSQLEASYRLMAQLRDLSLVRFL